MNSSAQIWLLARSSGLLAYALLTLTVVAGLTLKTRMFGRAVPPAVITSVHQLLSTIGLLAVGVHVGMLLLDTHVNMPLIAIVVPGLAAYRTLATSLGVVAIELWLLVHFSFRLRKRIGVKRWRKLHYATFGLWALAAVHGLVAGSDSGLPWVQHMYAVSVALVVGLLGWRSLTSKKPARAQQQRATVDQTSAISTTPT